MKGGHYFELWLILPCILEWLSFGILCWIPFFWSLLCLLVLGLVTYSLIGPYFPGQRVVNSLGFGWFISNWILASFLYFTKIIQCTYTINQTNIHIHLTPSYCLLLSLFSMSFLLLTIFRIVQLYFCLCIDMISFFLCLVGSDGCSNHRNDFVFDCVCNDVFRFF
jgi:uncharacterized membrane protein YiaA